MKKTKTIYWIVTGLFAAFMMFSAIPDIIMDQKTIGFMQNLGYPVYFIPFIGVAKALGVIAILIPGYPRLKEWAYAGLIYDLAGAMYSMMATSSDKGGPVFMILIIAFAAWSYVLYHKVAKQKAAITSTN